jgi:hypothetical protein
MNRPHIVEVHTYTDRDFKTYLQVHMSDNTTTRATSARMAGIPSQTPTTAFPAESKPASSPRRVKSSRSTTRSCSALGGDDRWLSSSLGQSRNATR